MNVNHLFYRTEPYLPSDLLFRSYAHMHAQSLRHIRLFATPLTVAHQAPLSMEFSRQEYWNGLPFPTPGDLPDPGIELEPPASPTLAGGFFAPPGKPQSSTYSSA